MNWYLEVLKKYNVFTGRSRRSEYWSFIGINLMNSILILWLDTAVGTYNIEEEYGILNTVYGFLMLLPNIAVAIRRMHDVGKSGWYMLIPIYNIVLAITPGTVGENKYGADPKNTTLSN